MAVNRNVESGSNLPAYSEKREFMVEGKGFIVTMMESVVGKTEVSPFCALAETHKENTMTAIHKTFNITDLPCILYIQFLSTPASITNNQ